MIGFLLDAVVYVIPGRVIDLVLGPDMGDACRGCDDAHVDCYSDSRGVWRCGVCAMRVDA